MRPSPRRNRSRLPAMANAELSAVARVMGGARGADEALRRHAADVEAIAAEEIALDQRDLRAEPGGAGGADQARRAAADDNHIVFSRRRRIVPARRVAVLDEAPVMSIVG